MFINTQEYKVIRQGIIQINLCSKPQNSSGIQRNREGPGLSNIRINSSYEASKILRNEEVINENNLYLVLYQSSEI